MRIELAWWDLNENDPTQNFLSTSLTNQILEQWALVPNLTMKLWLGSEDTPRWGALMIWHGDKPDVAKMPRNMSADIIGRPPDHRIAFDVLYETSGVCAK
ncbi:hypothetical protein H0A36_20440 [Endozoicomonas sp. SM1973]|uniref:Uncharacterized protein n=1 Tax=Spartinivicinus marinus TaxID=2994442 RepID=A0A853I6K9_9GAMM|nr:hypothetical protein [Spartinivicinus marinus]MCX4028190.1 hypothetical protein [Spartinivicinus marinus]NYZ68389.1 hypothetical protein [Spartinivicinus marinus]